MRFLVLCPYLPLRADHGGRIRSGVLVSALRRLGEVTIAAPVERGNRDADALTATGGVELVALPNHESRTSIARKLGHWIRRRSDILERRWSNDARARVAELIASRPWRAVVVDSTFALPLLPRPCAPPIVLHLHNVESAIFARASAGIRAGRENLVRRVESRVLAGLEAGAATRAATTIVVSEHDRELLLDIAPRARVAVVENSVDVAGLPLLPRPVGRDGPRLLFVGSFDYPPNVAAVRELVVEHLPVLRASHPRIGVQVVGRDPNGEVGAIVRGTGVEASGFVADLVPCYERADAVYVPLRSGGGTRIKAIEAFALGRAVLSTRVGVEGLGVTEGVHYLSCETPQDGSGSLARVLRGEADAIVAAARRLAVERFDHAGAITRLVDAIRAAVG